MPVGPVPMDLVRCLPLLYTPAELVAAVQEKRIGETHADPGCHIGIPWAPTEPVCPNAGCENPKTSGSYGPLECKFVWAESSLDTLPGPTSCCGSDNSSWKPDSANKEVGSSSRHYCWCQLVTPAHWQQVNSIFSSRWFPLLVLKPEGLSEGMTWKLRRIWIREVVDILQGDINLSLSQNTRGPVVIAIRSGASTCLVVGRSLWNQASTTGD